jgi:hypothetical protein
MVLWFVGQAVPAPAQRQNETAISVTDPRPLARAIETLEARYGWVITYEDPRFVFPGDIEDVTLSVRRDGRTAPKVLIPRGGEFNFQYPTARGAAPNESRLLQQLLNEYHLTGHPGVFRLAQTDGVFHVIPHESRNSEGRFVTLASLLDARISIPEGDRSAFGMLGLISEAVSKSAAATLTVGTVPLNVMMQTRVQGGANNESARTVLLRTLAASNQKLSWKLLCGPGETPECALNIHVVQQVASP